MPDIPSAQVVNERFEKQKKYSAQKNPWKPNFQTAMDTLEAAGFRVLALPESERLEAYRKKTEVFLKHMSTLAPATRENSPDISEADAKSLIEDILSVPIFKDIPLRTPSDRDASLKQEISHPPASGVSAAFNTSNKGASIS